MLNRLNAFRRNRELCDVVFFVDEKEILAHKVNLLLLFHHFSSRLSAIYASVGRVCWYLLDLMLKLSSEILNFEYHSRTQFFAILNYQIDFPNYVAA